MTKTLKEYWKKIWYFIWKDNSVWSWIVNIILAFVIIKFLVYPGLGFALGTNFPIVAVVSSSMEHNGEFEQWWQINQCPPNNPEYSQAEWYERKNITRTDFKEFPFKNGFNKGDLMILSGAKNVKQGDILVFATASARDPIIHRVITVNDEHTIFSTKGDNNCDAGRFEERIPADNALGKAVMRVPFLGWIKLGFVNLLKLFGVLP